MVVQARLSWLREQVRAGHNVTVHFTRNHNTQKDKVRFCISTHGPTQAIPTSSLILSAIDMVRDACMSCVVVDRGHRFSDGSTEASFWLKNKYFEHAASAADYVTTNDEGDGGITALPLQHRHLVHTSAFEEDMETSMPTFEVLPPPPAPGPEPRLEPREPSYAPSVGQYLRAVKRLREQ